MSITKGITADDYFTAKQNFKDSIGNKIHGSGGDCLINFFMSMANENVNVNIREASYKLDLSNKLILLDLFTAVLLYDSIKWDLAKEMEWVKENQPDVYSLALGE